MYFNDSHCFNYEDPQSDGPAFVAENIWPFGAKWPPLLFQCASLETASYPQRLAQGRGYQSRVSFLKPDQWKLHWGSGAVMVLAARPTTYSYLMIGCTLQPSYQTAICAPDSSGAVFLGVSSICISWGQKPLWIRGWRSRDATPSQKNCYHLLQWSIRFEYLALSPILHQLSLLFIPGSSGTVVKWICYGAVFFFPWEFLLPYTSWSL